ncbi:MAG: hypothetical protein KKC68_02545 [Candidatus Thermoplasmatota archaeon]|nr:hypothetical protein [Candidatus Thermoplasmatota archaeon]MBU1940631.1 hypothetical protein [Candidatus Thermoplasmatota archaeon]
MKKFFSIVTLVLMSGVVLYGSGCVAALDVGYLQTIEKQGFVQFGMETNASFLAQIPVVVYMNPNYASNVLFFHTMFDFEISPRMIATR